MFGSSTLPSLVLTLLTAATFTSAQQRCSRVTVRKEMNDLTPEEWNTYVSTIRQAATTPGNTPGQTMWEEFAAFHMQLSEESHGNCLFLPWHRMFLAWAERRLQTLNPNFAFFYWDAARDWNRAGQARIWNYLGRADGVVTEGPLAGITFSGTTQNQLIRDFRFPTIGNLPSVEAYSQTYQQSLSRGGFGWYSQQMEMYHGILHTQIGGSIGQMNSMWSPLDPIFWSHHGHMDWLWFQAQNGWRDAGVGASFQVGGNTFNGQQCSLSTRLSGFVEGQTINDVMDPSNVCVRYALPGEPSTPGGNSTNPVPPVPTSTATTSVPPIVVPTNPAPANGIVTIQPVPASGPSLPSTQPGRTQQQILFERYYRVFVQVTQARGRRRRGHHSLTAENGTISNLNATAPAPPTARVLLPADYAPVNACPNRLSDSWLQMNYKRNLTAGQAVRDEILNRCHEVVRSLQTGHNVTMFPLFLDTPDRPVVVGNHSWGTRQVIPQALYELSPVSVSSTPSATSYPPSATTTTVTIPPSPTSYSIVSSTITTVTGSKTTTVYTTAFSSTLSSNPYPSSTVKPILSAGSRVATLTDVLSIRIISSVLLVSAIQLLLL